MPAWLTKVEEWAYTQFRRLADYFFPACGDLGADLEAGGPDTGADGGNQVG